MRFLRPVSIALAATALAPTVAHAAQAPTDQLQVPTPVAGYDGVAMWSQYDDATKAFRLVKSVDGGAPQAVGVPERPTPFDVDLGSNRSGSTYAVYTRGGDVYRLGVATGTETKLTTLSSPTMEERDPTIQRGRIAFIRRDHGYDQLRVGGTTSAEHGTKLLVKSKEIEYAELGNQQVSYVLGLTGEFGGDDVHVRNITTGHDQSVFKATAGGASSSLVTKPSFPTSGDAFIFARSRNAAPGNQLIKYTLRTGKLSFGADRERVVSSAWVNDAVGAVTSTSLAVDLDTDAKPGQDCSDAGIQYCSVAFSGPVAFDQSQKK